MSRRFTGEPRTSARAETEFDRLCAEVGLLSSKPAEDILGWDRFVELDKSIVLHEFEDQYSNQPKFLFQVKGSRSARGNRTLKLSTLKPFALQPLPAFIAQIYFSTSQARVSLLHIGNAQIELVLRELRRSQFNRKSIAHRKVSFAKGNWIDVSAKNFLGALISAIDSDYEAYLAKKASFIQTCGYENGRYEMSVKFRPTDGIGDIVSAFMDESEGVPITVEDFSETRFDIPMSSSRGPPTNHPLTFKSEPTFEPTAYITVVESSSSHETKLKGTLKHNGVSGVFIAFRFESAGAHLNFTMIRPEKRADFSFKVRQDASAPYLEWLLTWKALLAAKATKSVRLTVPNKFEVDIPIPDISHQNDPAERYKFIDAISEILRAKNVIEEIAFGDFESDNVHNWEQWEIIERKPAVSMEISDRSLCKSDTACCIFPTFYRFGDTAVIRLFRADGRASIIDGSISFESDVVALVGDAVTALADAENVATSLIGKLKKDFKYDHMLLFWEPAQSVSLGAPDE